MVTFVDKPVEAIGVVDVVYNSHVAVEARRAADLMRAVEPPEAAGKGGQLIIDLEGHTHGVWVASLHERVMHVSQ